MQLTAIDLFSGCGGLTMGLKQAGFSVLAAVEVDELAAESYLLNHPEVVTRVADIRRVRPSALRKKLGLYQGQLDMLAGCPPCQGFSTLRTRNAGKAAEDERNDLVLSVITFVRAFLPRSVMLENVPGLVGDDRMVRFEAALRSLGYEGSAYVLNANEYGVPQRRRRLMYLAGHGQALLPAPRARRRPTVRDTIGHLPPSGESGDPLHDLPENRSRRIMRLIRRIPKDGGSRRDAGARSQLKCHRRCSGFYDVYGRMAWDEVAPTITSGCHNPSRGRFLHPEEDRAITIREAALLQSFPPDYQLSLRRGKEGAARLIGNALPPEFVRRHALAVGRALSG